MFLGRSFTLATILLYGGVVWTVNGLTLKDVFVVHTAPDPGGCSADQQTILERWYQTAPGHGLLCCHRLIVSQV